MNEGKVTILTLLDYSKAFDTINYRLLLAKLKSLGFSSNALEWFGSYLYGRSQKVVYELQESKWQTINNGVPQGSILGPLLFIIMVSDISKFLNDINYHLYADDTQLYHHSSLQALPDSIADVNHELSGVYTFSNKNALRLNASKTVYMIIGSRAKIKTLSSTNHAHVCINSQIINKNPHVKNLGITFDEILSWRKHIDQCITKSYFKLKQLYRFKTFLSTSVKKILCDLLVLSTFNYCDIVYFNLDVTYKNKIQKVQNSCVRFIYGLKKSSRSHISPYIKKLSWLNMNNRRLLHCCGFMYKIVRGDAAVYLNNMFQFRGVNHSYSTRQSEGVFIEPVYRHYSHKSFLYYGPTSFNSLPEYIKSAGTITKFKTLCKVYFISQQ